MTPTQGSTEAMSSTSTKPGTSDFYAKENNRPLTSRPMTGMDVTLDHYFHLCSFFTFRDIIKKFNEEDGLLHVGHGPELLIREPFPDVRVTRLGALPSRGATGTGKAGSCISRPRKVRNEGPTLKTEAGAEVLLIEDGVN